MNYRFIRHAEISSERPVTLANRSGAITRRVSAGRARLLAQAVIGAVEIHQPVLTLAVTNTQHLAIEDGVRTHLVRLGDAAVEIDQGVIQQWRAALQGAPACLGKTLIGVQITAGKHPGDVFQLGAQHVHTEHAILFEMNIREGRTVHAYQQRRGLVGDAAYRRGGKSPASSSAMALRKPVLSIMILPSVFRYPAPAVSTWRANSRPISGHWRSFRRR